MTDGQVICILTQALENASSDFHGVAWMAKEKPGELAEFLGAATAKIQQALKIAQGKA